jgi:peroxiredoxin
MKWRSLEESISPSKTRSLCEVYGERKALNEKYVPADVRAIHARVVAELKESGIAERALKPGDAAPSFQLPDQNGKIVRSADLLQRGPLVVFFIRGRWCPFCVGQAQSMNETAPIIQSRGAELVAVSPQTVHQNFLMADQHKLSFLLLSDQATKVASQYGLTYQVPDYQKDIYRRAFVNLPFLNGDESWELPIPATYIVAKNGSVAYASADPDYAVRPEPAEIAGFLSSIT